MNFIDKLIKKSMILGGIWGLITGVIYTVGVYSAAFTGSRDIGAILKNIPIIWKIVYLPAFLTDTLGGLLGKHLLFFGILGPLPFIFIWCILIPIFFGILIGAIFSLFKFKKSILKR